MQNLEFDTSRLRGRIIEKFGSNKNFANHVPQSPSAISKLLKNQGVFTQKIILKWASELEIAVEDIGYYFFHLKGDN